VSARRSQQLQTRLSRALENFNPQGAHNVLDEIFASMSLDGALSEVILPYLRDLDVRPDAGAEAIAGIQFSTGVLESRLLALASGWESGGEPTAVIAYLQRQPHKLAGICFGLTLRDRGWRIAYLGEDATLHAVLEAAEAMDAGAVVLASASRGAFHDRRAQLRSLGTHRTLLIAGRGATEGLARQVGALRLPSDPVTAAHELDERSHRGVPARSAPHPGRAAPR
jgi:hypothetical protein